MRLWYEERWTGGYDWNRPGYSPDTGSFTQVVWKSTDTLGCGRAAGRPAGEESYRTYIVCAYGPAGTSSVGSGRMWESRSARAESPGGVPLTCSLPEASVLRGRVTYRIVDAVASPRGGPPGRISVLLHPSAGPRRDAPCDTVPTVRSDIVVRRSAAGPRNTRLKEARCRSTARQCPSAPSTSPTRWSSTPALASLAQLARSAGSGCPTVRPRRGW
ncbi:CAP domain-containing protein [Streptomyces tricolor]|nr:CAP domain-containing protein [Streptomyces tricolor]